MEFPHLGQRCSEKSCWQLDFLPVKCDACQKIFCKDHMLYVNHNCEAAYKMDVQVPICPLCSTPIPVKRGEPPDIKVGEHIDNECQSDPARQKRKIYTNKCSLKGCRQKEMVNITCNSCHQKFCLKHRHPQDHGCKLLNTQNNPISKAGAAALLRVQEHKNASSHTHKVGKQQSVVNHNGLTEIQGNLTEDEALARALQISLMDTGKDLKNITSQEEENQIFTQTQDASRREQLSKQDDHRQQNGSKDRCNIS